METTEAVEAQVQQPDMNEAPAPTTEVPTAKRKGNSAQRTLTTLCNLYFSENKPDDLQPLDVALATYLILRQSDDHVIFDSQDTLAGRLGCERKAIARSLERLKAEGWVTVEVPYQWSRKAKRKTRIPSKTSGLGINLGKLPQIGDRTKRTAPTEDAKNLAKAHTTFLRETVKRSSRRLIERKLFREQQERAAQRVLDETDMDVDGACELLTFAVRDSRFSNAVTRSLYEVRKRLPTILKAFREAKQQQPEAAAPAAPDSSQPPQ